VQNLQRVRGRHAPWGRCVAGVLCLLPVAVLPAWGSEDACAAWPGEIDPLPTISEADPFAARWARLRVAELAALATSLEPEDPAEAYRLWKHLACMAPRSSATARAEGLRPEFRVALRPTPVGPVASAPSSSTRRERAPEPPAVAERPVPSGEPKVEPGPDFVRFDAQLAAAEEGLRLARFREVLQTTDRLRTELESQAEASGVRERRVRVEVLGASALVALGLPGRAAEGFGRALRIDPDLVLDPTTTPPKIRALLEEVRGEQQQRGER